MPPKHLSGCQKRKKRQHDEELKKSQAGDILKFLTKTNQDSNVEENIGANVEEDTNNIEEEVGANIEEEEDNVEENNIEEEIGANVEEEDNVEEDVNANVEENIDIFDPTKWGALSPNMMNVLIEKGPKRDLNLGPKDKYGRRFRESYYTRTLPNMEKCDRPWLVYWKELDKAYCFCCKLFKKGIPKGGLDGDGYSDWSHVTTSLKEHEVTLEHMKSFTTWHEMRDRLKVNKTIDKVAYEHFKKEREYWKKVLLRITEFVKYLGKHNLAFRGTNEKLYQENNGNFLGLVEMAEKFDPIVQEHVRRITSDELHIHYLGHNIQNELIFLLGQEVKSHIITKIKQARYYSIILDCTPDSSHQEQMSLIVRYVTFNSNSVTVEESFLGFLNVDDTTGKGIFDITCNELQSLGLDINDMRGQGYDNGSNMKGKHQGVQRRFLDINPRAFYTPCGCHSLNPVLCNMAKHL